MTGDTGTEFCKTEVEGRLLVVTIDRPEVMNALHPAANRALAAAFAACGLLRLQPD